MKGQSRKFETVLFIGLIIDQTLYRNSIGDREIPIRVNFSKTVTLPRVPPDQLSWIQDRCCPLRYIRVRCTRDSSLDPLRRRFFLDEERRWMRSGQSWTSFDSHGRREKSIFFISENAFCYQGLFIAHVELSGRQVTLNEFCWNRRVNFAGGV